MRYSGGDAAGGAGAGGGVAAAAAAADRAGVGACARAPPRVFRRARAVLAADTTPACVRALRADARRGGGAGWEGAGRDGTRGAARISWPRRIGACARRGPPPP